MNLQQRLEKDNKERNNKKKRNVFDEDEETLTYKERPKPVFLNDRSHTFDRIGDDSFHVAPSVFDRQAIFHTGGNK